MPALVFGVEGGGSGPRDAAGEPGTGNGRPATGGRVTGATAFGVGATGRGCARRAGGAVRGGTATRGACRVAGGLAVCCFALRRLSACSALAMPTPSATKAAATKSNRP